MHKENHALAVYSPPAFAGTHYTNLPKDGRAELTVDIGIASYVLRWITHRQAAVRTKCSMLFVPLRNA